MIVVYLMFFLTIVLNYYVFEICHFFNVMVVGVVVNSRLLSCIILL